MTAGDFLPLAAAVIGVVVLQVMAAALLGWFDD